MKYKIKQLWLIALLSFFLPVQAYLTYANEQSPDQKQQEGIMVGRVSHIDGQLLRYVPEEEDWVETVEDTPFGMYDVLYSLDDAKAEIILPNNTWVRIGSDTQVQMIELNEELTEINFSSGTARLYNKSSVTDIKAKTPFGLIMASPETAFDIYITDQAVEVSSLRGTVYFVHKNTDIQYEVIAGSSSIIAYKQQVTASEGRSFPGWNTWNKKRDNIWEKRMQTKGTSACYLPPNLHDEAYILEQQGCWEPLYYDGSYRYFWRPSHVKFGWAPFTEGRWTVWCGEHTWIPCEPFGYLTHHYGNWIYTHGFWYWAPPATPVMISAGLPLLNTGFGWYPGRVAWVHSGIYIGWIPLAPHEYYYSHYYWGPCSVLVTDLNINNYYFDPCRYRYHGHAVIIDHKHFNCGKNYSEVKHTEFRHAKNIRMVTVPYEKIGKNFRNSLKNIRLTDARVAQKPNKSAISNIKKKPFLKQQKGNDNHSINRIKAVKKRSALSQKDIKIMPLKSAKQRLTKQKHQSSPAKVIQTGLKKKGLPAERQVRYGYAERTKLQQPGREIAKQYRNLQRRQTHKQALQGITRSRSARKEYYSSMQHFATN